ncbi:MAG TPA: M24 family metallopeptidase [Acidobacteriaceae bacterium]|nr:M24 family metallopeptidase [Acidobacteriaceae bacterium]
MQLEAIQAALREAAAQPNSTLSGLDGWLFYDHHHRDPVGERILGLDAHAHVTRRWYYFIPAIGEPRKLVHRIEARRLDGLPGTRGVYSSWQELARGIDSMLTGVRRVAMQYSPRNTIMYVSMADAGTVEFVRSLGKEVVSSADLVSRFEAVLSAEQMASHQAAQRSIDSILAQAFRELGRVLHPAAGPAAALTEFEMVQWFAEAMRREDLVWENGPNVSVGANSADSHYEPTAERSQPIRNGDFLLIDIWGRKNVPNSIHYDITWTGVIGREPTALEQRLFTTVREARDAAILCVERVFAEQRTNPGRVLHGFEPDDAAREVIRAAGFGEYFTHRTGHNIALDLHGSGANLDNLESHDDRLILPNTCFSVEPGIYLPPNYEGHPQFGVRSEVNMLTSPGRAWVTGPRQQELVRI